MDVLNSREWAILVWLAFFTLYIWLAPRMAPIRHSLRDVIKCFFVWKIQAVLILALFYVSLVIYFLYEINFWHVGQFKNTLIWFVAVVFLSFFDLEKYKQDRGLFRKILLDNIKLIALVEFLIGFYVLPFLVELILFPVLVFITMTHAYSQTDEKYKSVEILFGMILTVSGFSLIIYALYGAVSNFSEFARPETAEDFFLPPLLTFTYLPFIFILVVYTTYENIFVRLQFSVKNKWVKRFTKAFALIVFNFRIHDLERWVWMLQVRDIKTIRDVLKTWQDFRSIRKVEKPPPTVSKNEGWSPYEAQSFLNDCGIEAGHYKESDGEWFASSPPVEFGDGIILANIVYYIDGNSRAAKSLKLTVNINDPKDTDIAREKVLEASEALYNQAVGGGFPKKFQRAILNENDLKYEYPPFNVVFEKQVWAKAQLKGYSLKFRISMLEGKKAFQTA